MKKPTKTAVKPAAKATAVSTKRPRTYKKADLPRTARAYLGKTHSIHLLKENEAVAQLIEITDATRKQLIDATATRWEQADKERNAYAPNIHFSGAPLDFTARNFEAILKDPQPKKLTLREQFLAWIGVKNGRE
jgi:hypothetical protein